MRKVLFASVFVVFLSVAFGLLDSRVAGARPQLPQEGITSPSQLIDVVNGLRLAYGLHPLSLHPILMQTAQGQADYMAATGQITHERPGGISYTQQLLMLGFPLSGDLTLGGYRAENILMESSPLVWSGVPPAWQDDLHMNTMLSPHYTHIGAGISQGADGYYYAVDCAAATNTGQMQSEASSILTGVPGTGVAGDQAGISQYMLPVLLSTARPDGDVLHKVQYGQTLWSIAIAYGTTIDKIRGLNNLGTDNTVYEGQVLLVQKGATQPPPASSTPVPSPTSKPTVTSTVASLKILFPTMTIKPTRTRETSSATGSPSSGVLVGLLIMAIVVGGAMAAWLIREPK
jgi:uncharacterized protein YkwD/LysM repeat protein